jgi:multidrug resistance efflux pump
LILGNKAALATGLLGCSALALFHLAAHAARPSPLDGLIEPEATPVISPMGGKIGQILAHRGDRVVAGQLLLVFEAGELDARLARVRSALRTDPSHLVDVATSLFQRIPPNTMARLLRTDPVILAAEQEYADSLGEWERMPSPASKKHLKRAEGQRQRAHQRTAELRPDRLSILRNLHQQGLETLRWLEAQRARFEVRAPADGAIELLDLQVGSIVPPLSPVALLDVAGRFVVRARADAKPGRRIEVVLPGGDRVPAFVQSFENRQLRASVLNPSITPAPGDKVQVFF